MQYDLSTHTTKLELRIMDLEDTTAALIRILKAMNEMIGNLNEMAGHYSTALTALIASAPTTRSRPRFTTPTDGTGSAQELPHLGNWEDTPPTPE